LTGISRIIPEAVERILVLADPP